MHIKSLTALLTLLLVTTSVYSAQSRPNIVVILSDDAGYTDLGSYGGEIDTPNLDALAEKGLKLSNFYSNARCSPTRATLLSGVDAAHVGFGGGVVGGRETCFFTLVILSPIIKIMKKQSLTTTANTL